MKRVLELVAVLLFSSAVAQQFNDVKTHDDLFAYNMTLMQRAYDLSDLSMQFAEGKVKSDDFSMKCMKMLADSNGDRTLFNLNGNVLLREIKHLNSAGETFPRSLNLLIDYGTALGIKEQFIQTWAFAICKVKFARDLFDPYILSARQMPSLVNLVITLLDDEWYRIAK